MQSGRRKLEAIALGLVVMFVGGCHRTATTGVTQPAPQPEEQRPASWSSYDLSFRVLSIASTGNLLWVCGSDETIAVSADNGAHWQVKYSGQGSTSLLNIDFANHQFGYAAGTDGALLMTRDGGETWYPRQGLTETILQVSFADPQHGIVRIPKSLLVTNDGGSHWTKINGRAVPKGVDQFPYTFSLVSLDQSHIAVMMKEGPAQFYAQAFLFSEDSGWTWKLLNIPNATIYSFLRTGGRYWAVGTEVIHKERPDGGYAVPVALYSSDGENWFRSANELSACKLEICTLCTSLGCLSSNGVIARIFSQATSLDSFLPKANLTAKWASTDSAICFVGRLLQCTGLRTLGQAPNNAGPPLPTLPVPGPLRFSGFR